MAYNPQTDCEHFKVYSAYTDRYAESHEVTAHKVATICIPCYGGTPFLRLVEAALARQGIHETFYDEDDGFLLNDDGKAEYFLEA